MPYDAPSRITIADKKSKSVTLTWKAPARPNGIIRGYEVKYCKDRCPGTGNVKKFNDTKGMIDNLHPNTKYMFQVRCRSSGGLGPKQDIPIQTLADSKFYIRVSLIQLSLF